MVAISAGARVKATASEEKGRKCSTWHLRGGGVAVKHATAAKPWHAGCGCNRLVESVGFRRTGWKKGWCHMHFHMFLTLRQAVRPKEIPGIGDSDIVLGKEHCSSATASYPLA